MKLKSNSTSLTKLNTHREFIFLMLHNNLRNVLQSLVFSVINIFVCHFLKITIETIKTMTIHTSQVLLLYIIPKYLAAILWNNSDTAYIACHFSKSSCRNVFPIKMTFFLQKTLNFHNKKHNCFRVLYVYTNAIHHESLASLKVIMCCKSFSWTFLKFSEKHFSGKRSSECA